MSDHARLSASGSSTWLLCPAAPRICDQIPKDDSSCYAEEGGRAHAASEQVLLGKVPSYAADDTDMPLYVEAYTDYVKSKMGTDSTLLVEQRVDLSEWVPESFGTSDAIIIHTDGSAEIIDLKYGKGVKVDAADNTQLRLYALGVLASHQFAFGIDSLTLTVVQPRLDHISSEELRVYELLQWGDWVKERAKLTEAADAPAVAGAKQCRWCKARAICRHRAVWALAHTENNADLLTPADLSTVLPHIEAVTQWVHDVTAHAMATLENGGTISGFKLVEGRSVRTLTDTAADTLLAAGLNDSQIYRQSYRTLSDIEKALGGKKTAAPVLESCTTKPAGKPAIVPSTDPRPALVADVVNQFQIGE